MSARLVVDRSSEHFGSNVTIADLAIHSFPGLESHGAHIYEVWEVLERDYSPDPDRGRDYGLRVLKSVCSGSEYYAAAQPWNASGVLAAFAIVCLARWNPKARSGEHFGYKDMSESMGPHVDRCPASVIELLGPPANEHAAEWRDRCRRRLALTRRRRPGPGDTLLLSAPMRFSDGFEGQSFEVIGYRKSIVLKGKNGGLYRITRLMERNWTLIPGSPARPHIGSAGETARAGGAP
jgi:hypothetical protein